MTQFFFVFYFYNFQPHSSENFFDNEDEPYNSPTREHLTLILSRARIFTQNNTSDIKTIQVKVTSNVYKYIPGMK